MNAMRRPLGDQMEPSPWPITLSSCPLGRTVWISGAAPGVTEAEYAMRPFWPGKTAQADAAPVRHTAIAAIATSPRLITPLGLPNGHDPTAGVADRGLRDQCEGPRHAPTRRLQLARLR